MSKRWLAPFLLTLSLVWFALLPAAQAEKADGRDEDKKVTVMIYMTGSDLEAGSMAATKDLEEMAGSGVDLSAVRVLVYTGGSPKWHNGVPEDVNALLVLEEDGFRQVDSFPRRSMGEAENLSRFLRYAYERYPAERFDLILWDHGNGPVMGYCLDRLYDNDTLTLAEMREALENSPFSADNRLGILGFDACLMASAELICTLGDYADYMIASQETEPNNGWNYAFLRDCGSLPAGELACLVVDDYLAFYEEYYADRPFFNSEVTLSVVDLSYCGQLREAIGALFRKAAPDVTGQFSRIAASRVQTRSFGRATTGSEYDLVDLLCLTEELGSAYPAETEHLAQLLGRMVLRAGSNTEQSCGVSLYFPFYNKSYYSSQWKDSYREMNVFPEYLSFLYRYEQIWLGADMQELFDTALNLQRGEEADSYFLPLTEEQLDAVAEGRCYILRRIGESAYAPVYVSAEVEKGEQGVTAVFDGNILYFTDDFGTRDILSLRLTDRVGTKTEYSLTSCFVETVPVASEGWELHRCDMQLSCDAADRSVEIRGVYETDVGDGQGTGKKTEIDLDDWKLLFFVELPTRFLTRTESGRIAGLEEWPVQDNIYGYEVPLADNIRFLMAPLYEDGYSYFLMLELTDVQGNKVCSEPFPLSVEPAPPAEETAPLRLSWDGEQCAALDLSGIRMRFRSGWDRERQAPIFFATVENGNEFPVEVRIAEPAADGLRGDSYGLYFSLQPGQSDSRLFSRLCDLLRRLGSAEEITFRVSATNADNYGTLFADQPIALSAPRPEQGGSIRLPFMDAAADEQLIFSEDGLEIRLLSLGFEASAAGGDPQAGDAALTAWYRVDNRSDEAHSVVIPALGVNGASVTTSAAPFTELVVLRGHNSCYFRQTLTRQEAATLQAYRALPSREDRSALIDSIASVSALAVVDGRGVWCPIALDRAGNAPAFAPGGPTLYEDETWRIRRAEGVGEGPEETFLLLENRSDQPLFFYLYAGESALASNLIGPRAQKLIGVQIPEDSRGKDGLMLRYYSWEDQQDRWVNYFSEREPTLTGPFGTEPAGEGGAS